MLESEIKKREERQVPAASFRENLVESLIRKTGSGVKVK